MELLVLARVFAPRGTSYNTVLETYKQSSYGHNIWSFSESDSVSNNELAWYFEWKHTDSGSDAQWPLYIQEVVI